MGYMLHLASLLVVLSTPSVSSAQEVFVGGYNGSQGICEVKHWEHAHYLERHLWML
jgi:hypothetical protein